MGARHAGDVMVQESRRNPAPSGLHYQIIKNWDEVVNFVDNFLPELVDNECYYIELFSRKKYDRRIPNSDTCNLVRHIATTPDGILRALRKMEVAYGTYYLKDTVVSQESLAVYITTSPRCRKKATFSLMKTLLEKISRNEEVFPHSAALTAIHRSRSRPCFVTFDIDTEDIDGFDQIQIFGAIRDEVGDEAVNVIKTRGGYHLLIDPKKVVSKHKNWHEHIKGIVKPDQTGDILSPIPGCVQGSHVPYMVVQSGKDR